MLTFEQLHQTLVDCAGEDEDVVLGPDSLDRDFADLGYDSLALLETSAQLKSRYGIDISEDTIRDLRTPRALLDHANALPARE
jgi:act minimal PKS acyl carrier protein